MLYFIFTVDGDWDEYFNIKLSHEKRQPNEKKLLSWLDKEIALASRVLDGKFLHFVHTSPLVRDFFLRTAFISRWRQIIGRSGSIGLHCHEETLYQEWYFDDEKRMENAVNFLADGLRSRGVVTKSYRGGFMAFSPTVIPILEKKDIFMDFSCDPGRHIIYGHALVSEWRGAPFNFYRMSYADHRQPGDSNVWEIPLGIYIEKQSLWEIWKKAKMLREGEEARILSVLAHTYDFKSFFMRLKIRLALLILKKYGKFVNAEEILSLVG